MAMLRLLSISLSLLAIGVIALPFVSAIWHVMAWAVVMGLGGGLIMVLFFSVWPRVYGRRHLGVIQGIAQAMTVLASALGPLLLAWCVEWTGSYDSVFYLLSAVIVALAAGALLVKLPAPAQEPTLGPPYQ
jgi:MFS family permease